MNTLGAYRGLKRLTGAATILLFSASLVIGYLYLDRSNSLWIVVLWAGVLAPVAATIVVLGLIGTGWWAPSMNGSAAPGKIRVPVALWVLGGIEIPWILAWVGANAMGNAWQHLHEGMQPAPYLWAVRLGTWLAAYSLASALAVLATILVDIRMTEGRDASLK